MPKLSKDTAAAVEGAEGGDFEPLPEDLYRVKLLSVESKEGQKAPYWSWTYEVDGGTHPEYKGRRLWDNTSLSEKALFRMKQVFDAFGHSTDTDTDDLIGLHVRALVTQETIGAGARKGQLTNRISKLYPDDHVEEDDLDDF